MFLKKFYHNEPDIPNITAKNSTPPLARIFFISKSTNNYPTMWGGGVDVYLNNNYQVIIT